NAAATCALDPVARTMNGELEGSTFRPARARKPVTAAVRAADGAYRASNWPAASQTALARIGRYGTSL
ncbi:MAG TPA: hypothetical protein VFX25_19450, partial [Streptosporangiaceae bacterium]|nr:hypothetical protein [Streptosporangiaceae bacterium]